MAADQGATAAPSDSGSIGEVVVTARRSSERLQDVPLAISAVTPAQLDQGHFQGLEDIANQVPGLKFTGFLDSFNGNVTIRGLQQEDVNGSINNVGTFLDGIYLQRGYEVDTSIGDFDRVEVVKGPQSALYGENTFAGAVNYNLKQPTDVYHLDATGTVGNAGLTEEKVGVGGPIVKGILDFRAYVAQSDYDGTWQNSFPGAYGESTHFGGHKWLNYSGALKFTPIDKLTISVEYSNTSKQNEISPYYTIDGDSLLDKLNCGSKTAGNGGYSLWCGNLPSNISGIRSGLGNPPPGLIAPPESPTSVHTRMWKAAASYKVADGFTLNYTYGNVHGDALEQVSFSTDAYNPDPAVPIISGQREGGIIDYFSHEVRAVYDGSFPIKGEVGYFYSKAVDQYAIGLVFIAPDAPYFSQTTNPVSIAGEPVPFSDQSTTYTTSSPFGRLTYSFLQDRATVSAEVRSTTTTLALTDLLAQESSPTPLPILKASYTNITPRFTAEFKLAPDDMIYVSAARGAKAGGFNGYVSGSLTLLASQQAFGEETNWTYEAGWKATLLDHKLTVNADVFYIDWKNRQESVVPANYVNVVNSQSAGVVPTIYENVGNASSYGFEMTTQWRATEHISAYWNLSLQNPTFGAGALALAYSANCDNIVCPKNGNISGNEIPLVSKVTSDFGGDYHGQYQDVNYSVGVDEEYRGSQYADDVNTAAIAAFWLTNAHLTLSRNEWTLSVWGKNLTNQAYVSSTFSIPVIYQYNANLGELRTFGATISVHY
jgi:iron complex outermembrane receptor protein